ncbi:MAG: hypothetical protein C4617_03915 [Candidatus Liberibacter europaeus]|uniref:Uncharacterized protein n=1 Tax=Candidatus Liberibacter europaeus TaxID=744859 RepID=A0A2T4VX70_9HYPH|nr:hypothetical protein [Candidatus Liberibacter europaeus]PTL86358.1 MAG: hypothetical protein C4617_03915 [Candidatus Liberibacter europaeus]
MFYYFLSGEQIYSADEHRLRHTLFFDSNVLFEDNLEKDKPEHAFNSLSLKYSIKKSMQRLYVKGNFIVGCNKDSEQLDNFPYFGSDIAYRQKI